MPLWWSINRESLAIVGETRKEILRNWDNSSVIAAMPPSRVDGSDVTDDR
jgi:hypothetical protein